MRVLVIHHLESLWESGYKNQGTSFDELVRKAISHIRHAKYDKVILTQFENWQAQDEHYESGIAEYINEWHDYGYGWDYDSIPDESFDDYVKGGNHSEYVYLPEWMKNLKYDNVSICGAFDGECIEDLEIALQACNVKFRRIEKLIV